MQLLACTWGDLSSMSELLVNSTFKQQEEMSVIKTMSKSMKMRALQINLID